MNLVACTETARIPQTNRKARLPMYSRYMHTERLTHMFTGMHQQEQIYIHTHTNIHMYMNTEYRTHTYIHTHARTSRAKENTPKKHHQFRHKMQASLCKSDVNHKKNETPSTFPIHHNKSGTEDKRAKKYWFGITGCQNKIAQNSSNIRVIIQRHASQNASH